jgi:hypothetical protein
MQKAYLVSQNRSAYFMIIRFRLLKCSHNRLKETGCIFGKKRSYSSEDDVLLTRRLCSYGGIVEIEVLDHIVIGSSGYVSMKEKRLI